MWSMGKILPYLHKPEPTVDPAQLQVDGSRDRIYPEGSQSNRMQDIWFYPALPRKSRSGVRGSPSMVQITFSFTPFQVQI